MVHNIYEGHYVVKDLKMAGILISPGSSFCLPLHKFTNTPLTCH